MNLSGEMLQFLGSLAAILLLAGLSRMFGLGKGSRLADEHAARVAAGEAVFGFVAEECAIDREGKGAILEDRSGRLLLLKPHGSKFAGRLLGPHTAVGTDGERLTVHTGERRFGDVTLSVADGTRWASKIELLGVTAGA